MDKKIVKEHLIKTFCYRCGSSLEGASIVPINEIPLAMTAHITCPNCKAESMVTITTGGAGVFPVTTDLTADEIKNFLGADSLTTNDLLELHSLIKKDTLWNLLQKKESNLVKKVKNSQEKKNSRE
ncbi:MAG: hypothetical protein AAB443_01645 [Patescibacteria group bacterium]